MTMTEELPLFTPGAYYTRSASTSVEVVDLDKGQVLGRLFRIGEVAHVVEEVAGELVQYDEHFMAGCTTKQRQDFARSDTWHKLGLQLGHEEPALAGRIGYALDLTERDGEALARFQLYGSHPHYAHIREMLATSHRRLSVQFHDVAVPVVERGEQRPRVGRRQVVLEHTAAVTEGAYPSAGVLAMRGASAEQGTPNLDAVRAMLAELRG